jgi:hypothetical protein
MERRVAEKDPKFVCYSFASLPASHICQFSLYRLKFRTTLTSIKYLATIKPVANDRPCTYLCGTDKGPGKRLTVPPDSAVSFGPAFIARRSRAAANSSRGRRRGRKPCDVKEPFEDGAGGGSGISTEFPSGKFRSGTCGVAGGRQQRT